MNPEILDAEWISEAEMLEERVKELEKQSRLTTWAVLLLSIAVFCLAVRVVLG